MDEGRYGQVRRQEDRHRKFVCIINDILKARTDVYESCLSREKYETSFRYVKNVMTVRRAAVRQKVLQKCLEMRRRGTEGKRGQFGRYDGTSLRAMSRDVEAYIASKHPKVRRLQKVQRLLKDSIDNGAILDADTMTCKVEDFLRKKIENMDTKYKEKHNPQNDSPDARKSQEMRDVKGSVSIKMGDKVKLQKIKISSVSKVKVSGDLTDKDSPVKGVSDEKPHESTEDPDDVFVLKRRPTLILPPIATNRALVQGVDR